MWKKKPSQQSWMQKVEEMFVRGNGRKQGESLKMSRSDLKERPLVPMVRDFTMIRVAVSQDDHTILSFEIIKNDNDISVISMCKLC